jgi:hypothetical protein
MSVNGLTGTMWKEKLRGFGLPQSNCFVNVLYIAMSVDCFDPCGVYLGTTGGQVYASADSGDSWTTIVRGLPPVLSVDAQTLPRLGLCCQLNYGRWRMLDVKLSCRCRVQ